VLGRLASRVMKRYAERMQALQPELKELQRAHRDDKAAQQEALMRFYREHNVNPLSSCLPTLVISVIAPWVPALLSPWRQNLPDRLAGIIWVVDNPPS
jgi:membrane protein insertase Oxa1/YidC/SpoIIIJ